MPPSIPQILSPCAELIRDIETAHTYHEGFGPFANAIIQNAMAARFYEIASSQNPAVDRALILTNERKKLREFLPKVPLVKPKDRKSDNVNRITWGYLHQDPWEFQKWLKELFAACDTDLEISAEQQLNHGNKMKLLIRKTKTPLGTVFDRDGMWLTIYNFVENVTYFPVDITTDVTDLLRRVLLDVPENLRTELYPIIVDKYLKY